MTFCTRALLLGAAVAVLAAPLHAQVHLRADFNDKPVDVSIGTGGASAGEPASIHFAQTAVVRATPMPTPSLELEDTYAAGSGSVRFEFLDSAEISSGRVSVAFDVWFPAFDNAEFSVRDLAAGGECIFTGVQMYDDGMLAVSDTTGWLNLGFGYPTGRVLPLRLLFDLDAGTYDLYVDGALEVADRPHSLTGCSIGSFLVFTLSDGDVEGTYFIDEILIQEVLFSSGFERGSTDAWSAVQ